jgi:hypothetical protein
MNLRHAAALALVGWYLMSPPIGTNREFLYQAPLHNWHVAKPFDSAKECETYLQGLIDLASHSQVNMGDHTVDLDALIRQSGSTRERVLIGLQYEQCVATDDPRLKEK